MNDGNDLKVPEPPSAWQKKVLATALALPARARTAAQKKVIKATRAWRKKAGWKPPPPPVDPNEVRRKAIVKYALWTVERNHLIYYSQSRPKPSIRENYPYTQVPASLDCSSHAIRCYQVAKCPSPSAYGYSGFGSTWDMEPRGKPVSDHNLLPGDLCFYRGHVVVYIGGGQVVSHGSQLRATGEEPQLPD